MIQDKDDMIENEIKRSQEETLQAKYTCPECDEYKPDDARIQAGMRCGECAYSHGD